MTFKPQEIISSRKRLREIMRPAHPVTLAKDLDHLNHVAKRFIEMSSFYVMSSLGDDGLFDMSPKGDPAGSFEVVDDHTLILADRLGNHRLDTFENLLKNPAVGLIFLIPGHTETLRVSGTAKLILDRDVQKRHAVNGKEPVLAVMISVKEVFMHCSKAFTRGRMWQPDTWAERGTVPMLSEWVKSAVETDETVEEMQEIHDNDAATRLY